MYYKEELNPNDIDLSDDLYIINSTAADAYLQKVAQQQSHASAYMESRADGDQRQTPIELAASPSGVAYGQSDQTAAEGVSATGTGNYDGRSTSAATHLRWSGQVPPQKWTIFYTKVLSTLVNTGELSLTVSVDAIPTSQVTLQRVETMKAALRELGLQDNVRED
jgi:hypothetical protein